MSEQAGYSEHVYQEYAHGMHAEPIHQREEIVRCRDCKYARIMRPLDWRTGKPSAVIEEWYCQWHSNAEGASDIDPDGFCAWGERKEVSA